jgi:ATP-dependent helicase/nuclease subunit A
MTDLSPSLAPSLPSSAPPAFNDPSHPQRAAADPFVSAWVSASAGTGKTRVLTARVVRLLLTGVKPHRILCITYTRAAAAEMADRIQKQLSRWAIAGEDEVLADLQDLTGTIPRAADIARARRLFAETLDDPVGLRIQTIHGFCQSLLRRFPLEAGVPHHFTAIEDREAKALLAEARAGVMQDGLQDPDSPIGQAIAFLLDHLAESSFDKVLADIIAAREQFETVLNFGAGLAEAEDRLYRHLDLTPGQTEADLIRKAVTLTDPKTRTLRDMSAVLQTLGLKTDSAAGIFIAQWLDLSLEDRAVAWDAYVAQYLKKTDGLPRTPVKAIQDKSPGTMQDFTAEAERIMEIESARSTLRVADYSRSILRLAAALMARYGALKAKNSALDYADLIEYAVRLLEHPGMGPWVLFKLDGGIDHVLLDEAQDTSPLQWRLMQALMAEFWAGAGASKANRTLFVVGDEKQSIFRFQGADPDAFQRMQNFFTGHLAAADKPFRRVGLHTSFRSTAAILQAVDAVFAPDSVRQGVSADPVQHTPYRRGMAGQVDLWPPFVAEADTDPAIPWALPVTRRRRKSPLTEMCDRLADQIKSWLGRGEVLPARGRPIRPGDILVLVRTRGAFVQRFLKACKQRDIPVNGVDRLDLVKSLAVQDLLALTRALLLPTDDLTLATVLCGPFIGLSEDTLFRLAYNRAPDSLWDRLSANPDTAALACYLTDLKNGFSTPFGLLSAILDRPCPASPQSGRHALLARLGGEAVDPVQELLNAALLYQTVRTPTLQGFIAWIEGDDSEVKRDPATAGQAIRIMTAHGSKGLQAPVVILADTFGFPKNEARLLWSDDPTAPPLFAPTQDEADHHVTARRAFERARDLDEFRRLLYVALTRAEDRLLITGCLPSKTPDDPGHWYRLIEAGLQQVASPADFGSLGQGWSLSTPQTAPPKPEPALSAKDATTPLPTWALCPISAE